MQFIPSVGEIVGIISGSKSFVALFVFVVFVLAGVEVAGRQVWSRLHCIHSFSL